MADDDNSHDDSSSGDDGGERRFTQAQVDSMFADRFKKHRDEMERIEELRAQAEQVPRLEARVQALERERDSSRQETARERERADSSSLRAEVVSAATRAGAVDPEDVFRLLPEGSVKLEDGKAVGVEEAVKALSERKTHLFATARRPSGGDGGARDDGGGQPGRNQQDMSRLMRRAAGYSR